MVPTTDYHLSRQGDQNVPLRYLKGAEWIEEHNSQDLAPGYFATNEDSELIPIEFDFDTLQWGTATSAFPSGINISRPAPIEYRLHIYDEKRAERSQWGPRDGSQIKEETTAPKFRFGSEGDTPDPDLLIPDTDKAKQEEQFLAQLAQLIPAYIDKPSIPSLEQSPSLAAQMSQIAATTTGTSTSLLARTIGAGVSDGTSTRTTNQIWE